MRLQAIKGQLSCGFTQCSFLATAIAGGRTGEAHRFLGKLRQIVKSVRRHLDEPNHVLPDSVSELRDVLEQLEGRIRAIEARLPNR